MTNNSNEPTSTFQVTIQTGSFGATLTDAAPEVARILRDIADRIEKRRPFAIAAGISLQDSSCRTVGHAGFQLD